MKITNKLPQFENPTLFIVVGLKEAEFFFAHKGEIKKVEQFRIERPDYSDREDYDRRGTIIFESGAKFEKMQKEQRKNLLIQCKMQVENLVDRFSIVELYLFAPIIIMNDLKNILPKNIKIGGTITGNFQKVEMFSLIKKMNKLK